MQSMKHYSASKTQSKSSNHQQKIYTKILQLYYMKHKSQILKKYTKNETLSKSTKHCNWETEAQ